MPPPSLLQLVQVQCIEHIKKIDDVGDAPWELVEPFIGRVTNPKQLRRIEVASPQICGKDASVWRALLERDVRGYKDDPVQPKNPNNWYKLYDKLVKQADEQVKGSTAALKAALQSHDTAKQSQKITVLDKSPSKGRRTIEIARRSNGSSALRGGQDSRRGNSIIEKARKEAMHSKAMRSVGKSANGQSGSSPNLLKPNVGSPAQQRTVADRYATTASHAPKQDTMKIALAQNANAELAQSRKLALHPSSATDAPEPLLSDYQRPILPSAKRKATPNIFATSRKRSRSLL